MARRGDRNRIHLVDTDSMTAEALTYLAENEPKGGYYVGFSGGKDSIVTLALTRLAGVKHTAIYTCTRIDPPELVRFIREHYPDVEWLYPSETLWDAIRRKSPPLRMQRWCCDVLKKNPSQNHPLRHRVMGMRAEESSRRASRPRTDYMQRYKQWVYKPIFHWTEYHVWDFIERHNLPYPRLYDEGFSRIGCVVCPFLMHKNQTQVNKHRSRWPGMYRAFEHACRDWFEERMAEGLRSTQKHATFQEYMAAYYRGFE